MDRDAYRKKIFELDRKLVHLQTKVRKLNLENNELKRKLKNTKWNSLTIGDINDFKKEINTFRDNGLALPFDIE